MLDKQGYTLIVCNAFWFCMATVVKWKHVLCLYIHVCLPCYSMDEWLIIQEYSLTGGIRLSVRGTIHKSKVWCHCTFFLNKIQYRALWPVPIAVAAYKEIRNTVPQDSGMLKQKVKCTLVQALRLCTGRTVHSGSRGIALLYKHWGSVQAVRPIGGVEV
jgi:hypothetical protein